MPLVEPPLCREGAAFDSGSQETCPPAGLYRPSRKGWLMSRSSVFGALGAVACAACLLAPPLSHAEVVAHLRVLTAGTTLERGASYVTGTESIKTDPRARCFVGGAGGSGQRVRIQGPTALGLVKSAVAWNSRLAPISVTDEFGFGLGICGFGGKRGNAERYWSLWVDYSD